MSDIVQMISKDQVNHLQFFEYIDYLHNENEKFGYFGYYDQSRLVAIQYFSPLNTGISLVEEQYIPFLEEEVKMTSSTYLHGTADVISQFNRCSTRNAYLYKYGYFHKQTGMKNDLKLPVIQATHEDKQDIVEFYRDKEIMIEIPERLTNILKNGSLFLVKEGGTVKSIALAHSETSKYALIGGVYTSDDARGKGYALACCQALSAYLHQREKTPYLFYDSSLSHLDSFYRSLGFNFTADYLLLY